VTSFTIGHRIGVPRRVGVASAVVVNPSKVDDLDGRRVEIREALAGAGWPEPLWLPTTPEDPGCGMAQQALDVGAAVLAGTQVALAVMPAVTGTHAARFA
jgi:hypothetical protein